MRFVPLRRGLSALDPLLPRDLDTRLLRRSWEFGRLVLDQRFRSGPELVGRSIFLGMRELVLRTGAENVFASCSPAHARLYRRFGFNGLSTEISTSRSDVGYRLIHGEMGSVLQATGSDGRRQPTLSMVS